MITEIGTGISTIGLLLQLYSKHGEKKVRDLDEYKKHLRSLVATLYFSKSIHNLSHTIIDLDCVKIFDYDAKDIGIIDFQKAFDASFGQLLQSKMNLEISPNLSAFKATILNEPESYKTKGLPNSFNTAVNSLNYCYPKMISTYEELHDEIYKMLNGIVNLRYEPDYEVKLFHNFDSNRRRWKQYISLKNRELLTYADQTIMNGIVVLDTLFFV